MLTTEQHEVRNVGLGILIGCVLGGGLWAVAYVVIRAVAFISLIKQ